MKRRHNILIYLMGLVFASCASTNPCPENPAIGNLGSVINTGKDDYLPVVFENKLYFTSIRPEGSGKEEIYTSQYENGAFSVPVLDTALPLKNEKNTASPSFYNNTITGKLEMYFAGVANNSKTGNRDIFVCYKQNGVWTKPEPLGDNINTEYYESHPCIAPDGSYLLFSSDRPGGIGQIDLYISIRQPDNSWSKPENLGAGINTTASEISPFVASDGTLYFASKGYDKKTGFDIIKAQQVKKGQWANPKILPFPINTESDESGPSIIKDKLVLASNRKNGCGGWDIYAFQLCGPVVLYGKISSKSEDIPLKGKIELFDADNKKIIEKDVDNSGKFSLNMTANENYLLKYSNPCIPDLDVEQNIESPCSDSSTVKLELQVKIPAEFDNFNLENYKVPFFVSGYYYPNTPENLHALRLKFTYNLFGASDTTKYIEYPGKEYDSLAVIVEKALDDAVNFINDKLNYLNGPCGNSRQKLKVSIQGYADPRNFSVVAKYVDWDINDDELDFHVEKGTNMSNQLLSSLRAYYTAKYLENALEKNDLYINNSDRFIWEVQGKGVDSTESESNEMRRRVYVKVSVE